MLSLKKVYRDELLQLALLLSILRVNHDSFSENDMYNNLVFDNGTSWRSITPAVLRSHYVNPKSLDSVLLNYERDIFADLNSLGRFHRDNYRHPDVHTYLLNIERTAPLSNSETLPVPNLPNTTDSNGNNVEGATSPLDVGLQLSQEDMDLIEVLWKQDVDLGFSVENAVHKSDKDVDIKIIDPNDPTTSINGKHDDLEKIKTLQAINKESVKEEPEEIDDPWAGLDYTIDTETGEYVIKGELSLSGVDCSSSSCDLPLGDLSLPLPEFLLDEALRLVDLEDETSQENAINLKELENLSLEAAATCGDADELASGSEEAAQPEGREPDFDFLDDMIQTPQFHHPHHRPHFQGRMPFVRAMSMEQRWQDLATLLPSLPGADGAAAGPHPFPHPLHNYPHPHHPHPHPHHHHHHHVGYGPPDRGVLLHNATLPTPMGDLNASAPYGSLGGPNLVNAVATSMNLTNSSEPMGESASAPHYKLEPSHDMVYYQNGSSEMNQTDGFLSSILNDEDLQLMDMAMNEGMYTMRMLDGPNAMSNASATGAAASAGAAAAVTRTDLERMDASSDSAVSSMGSERVPSLSDGEWGDAGSDSGHTSAEHYVTDYPNKIRPFDYSYTSRQHNNAIGSTENVRMPPVAQKKHQMYGKRYFQEHHSPGAAHPSTPLKYEYREPSSTPYNIPSQTEGAVGPKAPEMKYSCSMDFGHVPRNPADHIQHNHTYHLPAESSGSMQRPVSRDKAKARKAEDEHLTRDEKRARSLNVPITVDDIINLPMDEFNERLSKYDLSETQLSLIRDIRRRGKNKVAAQNCRKRKLDQILSLADEVKEMKDRKMRLISDHEYLKNECKRMRDKYQQLYRHVFQNLRDPDGNHYSPYQYSLQTSADGSILMVPRTNSSSSNGEPKEPPQNED